LGEGIFKKKEKVQMGAHLNHKEYFNINREQPLHERYAL
jgi:hypothetical protein